MSKRSPLAILARSRHKSAMYSAVAALSRVAAPSGKFCDCMMYLTPTPLMFPLHCNYSDIINYEHTYWLHLGMPNKIVIRQ